jgi:hypothetical protein
MIATEIKPQVPPLPIMFGVSTERPRHAEDRQWSREHQETVNHLPFAERFGAQPPAEQDAAAESNRSLNDGDHQQNDDAGCKRVSRERTSWFGGYRC